MAKVEKKYKEISASKFRETCWQLFQEICDSGENIIVTKDNLPIAMVSPLPTESFKKVELGAMADQLEIVGDIIKTTEEAWS